jgi:hypothetical protein
VTQTAEVLGITKPSLSFRMRLPVGSGGFRPARLFWEPFWLFRSFASQTTPETKIAEVLDDLLAEK